MFELKVCRNNDLAELGQKALMVVDSFFSIEL